MDIIVKTFELKKQFERLKAIKIMIFRIIKEKYSAFLCT